MSVMPTVGIHLVVALEELVIVVGPVPPSIVPKLIIIVLVLAVSMGIVIFPLQKRTMRIPEEEIFAEIDHPMVIMVPLRNVTMNKIPEEEIFEEIVPRVVTTAPLPNETTRKILEEDFEEIVRRVVVLNHISKEVVERDRPLGTKMNKNIVAARFL
jgi:hypothetical protein